MKNILAKPAYLAFALLSFFALSCKEDPTVAPNLPGNVVLEFDNVVGLDSLALDEQEYTNANGDPFKVSLFKYYISNIILTKADGTEYQQPESYYLIDQSNPASKVVTLQDVPAGEYTSLRFTVGVDSARNVAGAQTGALDPANGMFWTWDTGYVFLKLEGTSPQSPNGGLVFHIGGFQPPHNTIRAVSPALNSQKIRVEASRVPEVHLKADVLRLFQGANPIKFAELATTMGGENSVKVADNYVNMFTVDHIHQ